MRVNRRFLRCAALPLLAAASVGGAAAQRASFHHYTNNDGLPQRQTLALYQDRSGYVWFGTYGGLSRYDGAAFRTFTALDGLSSNVIQSLAEDAAGHLVVGTIGGGVCLENGGRFACIRRSDGLADDTVTDLLPDAAGSLWVATEGGLSRVLPDGRVETFDGRHGLPASCCTALARDGAGTVWIGALDGLTRWNGSRFELVTSAVPPIRALAIRGSHLLIGTEAGLWRWGEGGLSRPAVPAPLAEAYVSDVLVDAEGGAWVATRAGVLRLHRGEERWLTRHNGLISDLVHTSMLDREGNVWFGTDAGTSKLVPGPFDTFGPESGLPHPFVRAVALDTAGRVWAGTRTGVGVLEGLELRRITTSEGLTHDRIYSLAPFGQAMLIGTSRGLIVWQDGPRRVLTQADGLPSDQVASLEGDGAGGVWVGTTHGLAHLSAEGRLEPFVHPAVDDRYVISQRRDLEGRLWLGLRSGGVVILDGESVTLLGKDHGLTDQTIWSLDVDRDGRVWVATNGDGVFGVRGEDVIHLTTGGGLVNDFVWQVFCDSRGAVWAYTNQGLDRWDGQGFVHYGLADGLVDLEGSANAVLEDLQGNLWFGTAGGLVRYVPRLEAADRVTPRIVIQEAASAESGSLFAGAELPFGSASVTFRFAGLSFRQERAVQYRHRLLGLSEQWSEPSPQRSIQFASLPPGAYELQVAARSGDGEWSEEPAMFPFTVAPAYWHRLWFRAGVTLALAALVGLAVIWRTRRLEVERQRLESVVTSRTAELQERTESLKREVESRRQAQRALLASEQRVRDILEHSTNLFFAHTADHVLTYVSSQSRAYLDCEPEEALLRWTEFSTDHPVNQQGFEVTQRAIDSGEPQPPYELQLKGVKGRTIWVQVSEAPVVRDGKTVAIVGALTDITQLKQAEEERRRIEDRLQQGQRLEAVGRLAGGIAHDFNNLLTTVLGYAELLSHKLGDDPELVSDLTEIRHAGDSAAALTQQLLAFSRRQVIDPEVLDVNDAIAAAVKLLRPLIGENIELCTTLDAGLESIKADRGQLEQILVNLAVNARDAMPSGGRLTIATSNRTVGRHRDDDASLAIAPGSYVCIEVSDTGTGMDEDTRSRVFEPFFSTKHPGQGTGLGLATVYGIAAQSQGHVSVESEVGRGAVFSVYLPVTDEKPRARPAGPEDTGSAPTLSRTVLVVEDDASVRSLTVKSLRQAGFQVLEAPDGRAALDLSACHQGAIDLLLTDLVMPGLNGREVAERLRLSRPDLKVLFMSGYPADVLDHSNARSDPSAFLAKPFSITTLVCEVRSILGS